MMAVIPKTTMQNNQIRRASNSGKPIPPKNPLQVLCVEKYRLNYLYHCRYLKRPPQSLRISGCNVLKEHDRLPLMSELESKVLDIGIKNKLTDIKKIEQNLKNSNISHEPLKNKHKKKWFHYFQCKIAFIKSQENTKWKNWPKKTKCDVSQNNNTNKLRKQKASIKKKADAVIQAKQVRVLTDQEVPPEAIVVLGKGLGFVPTPIADPEEVRLDGRRLCKKIAKFDTVGYSPDQNVQLINHIPIKLQPINYSPPTDKISNPVISQSIDIITTKLNALNPTPSSSRQRNLSKLEQQGLKWLQEKTSKAEIVVTQADKGGSILIIPPELIEEVITEKVTNSALYEHLNEDPRPKLYDRLIDLWKRGKSQTFVTEKEASEVVGLTKNNQKSTSSHFKPGTTYFSPSLKIHKLQDSEIKPGCKPPARIITCLQEGVTKRSDVFIANKWLKELEADFCTDLVKDTNSTLRWLDEVDKNSTVDLKMTFKPFTFDFESLYDSLTPQLVLESLQHAIDVWRPNWSPDFNKWLLENINHSMQSAVGVYKDEWYKPIKGIPTGGSLSVQLANIAVFYVLNKSLYTNEVLMRNIHSMKRFIDDEVGLFKGSERQFNSLKMELTKALNLYGLNVKDNDWNIAHEPGILVHFLDIQFGFSFDGSLVTDIHIKETDSHAFLNFHSCHPPHVFSSVLYSQALRYRRIINHDHTLNTRLDQLATDFVNSNYPRKMVDNIFKKVRNSHRDLSKKQDTPSVSPKVVKVISTYGKDTVLCDIAKSVAPILTDNNIISKFQYVKKTAASLRNTLSNSKNISLKNKHGKSKACNTPRCKNCKLMSNKQCLKTNTGKAFKSALGTCRSKNIIYSATCRLCSKAYVGKSTQFLAYRNNGHRAKFIKYCKQIRNGVKVNLHELDEENSLGIHLHQEHNIKTPKGFDDNYEFTILENCAPRNLSVKEHLWIQRLRTLYPHGLNLNSPYGLPLLVKH